MRITALPVYSKLADDAEVRATFGERALPVRLSQHQLETYRALTDPDVDVVINTAIDILHALIDPRVRVQ